VFSSTYRQGEARVGLRDFIGVARSRARLVILAAVVMAATALLISFLIPKSYQGVATVLLTQHNAGAALVGSPQQYQTEMAQQRDVQTQVDVMRSPLILKPVIAELKLDMSPGELRNSTDVRLDGQTNIVTITVTGSTPQGAAAAANAIAAAYVAWSQEHERASITAAVNDVQKRLEDAQKQIVDTQSTVDRGDSSAATAVKLRAANNLYSNLADQLEQLRINEQLSTGLGSVLMTASPDPSPVSPKPVRNAALGLALGMVLGFGVAFVAEALDTRIKSAEQAGEVYDAPVLCSIPAQQRRQDKTKGLVLVDDPGGPAAEAYRVLRNNLGFINFEHDIKTVLVTSALPNEGKSTVAANLATVLARAGKNVVLVGCDFHQPGSAQLFNVSGKFGLSDILRGTIDAKQALENPEGVESLWVIPAGSKPPNPSELLGSATMEALIASLRETSDWVILDSAPLLAVADAAAVARWVDGVLVVTQAGVSTRDAARKSRDQLNNVGARILGVAVWGLEDNVNRSGYSEYGGSTSE
jgi:polysaccharide biosynthesis transport protein